MSTSKAQRAATAQRRTRAIAMRLAGADYELIATQLGYASRAAACVDVTRAMEASLAEQNHDAEMWRHELLLGLQRLKAAMWSAAMAGDTKAADVAVRVFDRIAKLTGADAPQRHEVLTIGAVEAEIARLSAEMAVSGGEVVPSEIVAGHREAGPAS